jgi:solute carrier family 36 (proton-coupled amino acid transporter)
MMHYKVVSTKTWQKVLDIVLVIFGFVSMTYTTALTIQSWVSGGHSGSPGYCDDR